MISNNTWKEKLDAQRQERSDRIEQLQKERINLMAAMQHLVEQQVEASRLLGLNYDEQVRLQEEVDAEIARIAAEVVRLSRTLGQQTAPQNRDGQQQPSALRNGHESQESSPESVDR